MTENKKSAFWARNTVVFFGIFVLFGIFSRCDDVMDDIALSDMRIEPYSPPALTPTQQKVRTTLLLSGKMVTHESSGNIVRTEAKKRVDEVLGKGTWAQPCYNLRLGEGDSEQVFGCRKGFCPKFYRAWKGLADLGCEAEISETCRPFEAAVKRYITAGGVWNAIFGINLSFKVGKPWKSEQPRHGICSAVDVYRRCINNKKVPLGVVNGKLAYIGIEKKRRGKVRPLKDEADIELANAYLIEEFAEQIAMLQNAYDNFNLDKYLKWRRMRALGEANGWVYGAHTAIFQFAREEGLTGGFCGIAKDPAHYQEIVPGKKRNCKLDVRINHCEDPESYHYGCDIGTTKWMDEIDTQRHKNIPGYERLPTKKFLD